MLKIKKIFFGLFIVIAAVLVLGAGCANQPAKESANPAVNQPVGNSSTIEIKNFAFSPAVLTVQSGATIVWSNQDGAPHTIKSNLFESPRLSQGQTFEYKFDQPGIVEYSCGLHPSMKGKIIVQ